MTEATKKPTCGRCGVYRHLHPTRFGCEVPRLSYWWDRHSLVRHVAGRLWLALPEKRRWDIICWLYERHPDHCWCQYVDSAYLDIKKDDYRGDNGCGCDVPLPTQVGAPVYGSCYCTPFTTAGDPS